MAALFLLAVPSLVVAGCQSGNRHGDPFLGTWRYADSKTVIVISKAASGYDVSTVSDRQVSQMMLLIRHGNVLTGTFKVLVDGKPSGRTITEVIRLDPGKSGLTFIDGGFRLQLVKVGSGTSVPSPSFTG